MTIMNISGPLVSLGCPYSVRTAAQHERPSMKVLGLSSWHEEAGDDVTSAKTIHKIRAERHKREWILI